MGKVEGWGVRGSSLLGGGLFCLEISTPKFQLDVFGIMLRRMYSFGIKNMKDPHMLSNSTPSVSSSRAENVISSLVHMSNEFLGD